ncbi:hypothetical protein RRG08_030723 [Elysia crispata]|uniref:Uncharacterized protein n=1 Tax=Elysia crispata TaxID=231223 RepID=A0AAE0Y4T6_9GAST|nr:hypothetical protein RRG08_030723 [Elysia crispata]
MIRAVRVLVVHQTSETASTAEENDNEMKKKSSFKQPSQINCKDKVDGSAITWALNYFCVASTRVIGCHCRRGDGSTISPDPAFCGLKTMD